jgi:hypothetical protein
MSLLKTQLYSDEGFMDIVEKMVRLYPRLPSELKEWLWANYNTEILTTEMLEGGLLALVGLELSLPAPGRFGLFDILHHLIVDATAVHVLALAHRLGAIDLEPLKALDAKEISSDLPKM